jgi:hypothetical protein
MKLTTREKKIFVAGSAGLIATGACWQPREAKVESAASDCGATSCATLHAAWL